jgi:hypothetical protein
MWEWEYRVPPVVSHRKLCYKVDQVIHVPIHLQIFW